MRASDIVNQIASVLPSFIDEFTSNYEVSSLTRAGSTVTVTTAVDHNLEAGNQVNIVGAQTPIVIDSITRDGILVTVVTQEDHDITENAGYDIQISGATESEFNGTFELHKAPNRRTLTFLMDNSGPITGTGIMLLLNGSNVFKSYNGIREVASTPTTTTFTYEVSDETLYTPAHGTISAKCNPRISSAVDYESIRAAYTKQMPEDWWMFAVLGDGIADKSRRIDTDSTDNIQSSNFFNQRLIQVVQLFVLVPSSAQIAGRLARDRCEEILSPICQSVLTARFDSLVEGSNNPLMITGHGLHDYSGAFYVHQYAFECTMQMGESDIYQPINDVAFRDISLTQFSNIGTGQIETQINLDEEPI